MTNMIQPGDILELAAPYARESGEGALIGTIFGVAMTDLDNAERGSFAVKGVFELAKDAVTITEGEAAYWDASTKLVTDVSTSNTLIGVFVEAAASGVATAKVLIR
jgi:predicted RecA/RadA family phage recombinase